MPGIRQETKFLKVYDTYQEAIFRHCYFRVFNRERAKEIAQEAFMRAWEEVRRGTDVKNIKAFVYRVANNLIIDESRKKSAVSLEGMTDDGFQPTGMTANRISELIDGQMVLSLSKKLEPEYRQVLLMRYVDNLKPKEIAEIIGESQNVVSVRIHRAIKALQQLLHI